MLVGNARFERHDGTGRCCAAVKTGEVKHLLNMCAVLGSNILGFFIVSEVVLTIRQPKPALEDIHGVELRVFEVFELFRVERHFNAAPSRACHKERQVVMALECIYLIE